ncbi:MAG TPA: SDR family oxidoreductase [Capsulimonadaceae bacterium]|jgi:NAD(P)-dependent dehydrogenase (short-subunit alcohol dehydrogenase family)
MSASIGSVFSLAGQTALVTGGGRGIGRALATALARAGADIVILDRIEDNVRDVCAFLEGELGVRAYPAVADLSNASVIGEVCASISAQCGGVDILVNNAGNQVRKPALEFTIEEWNSVLAIHLTASFAMAQALVPGMIERGAGTIINIASLNSLMAVPNIIAYTTAKSGVAGLTRSMAVEWSGHGIRTNAIGPGWCRTELTDKLFQDPEKEKWVMGRIPMKRVADPENDLGYVAVFLASKAASYITGQVIYVDGGWLAS